MGEILILMGDHPRHHFLAKPLFEKYHDNIHVVKMKREGLLPSNRLQHSNKRLVDLYERHFSERFEIEAEYFGSVEQMRKEEKSLKINHIKPNELNTDVVEKIINNLKPEFLISIGIHVLRKNIIDILPKNNMNVHLGLSPRYRGDATLFWPTYNLEPWNCGTTFHKLAELVDGGDIYHQTGTVLNEDHGVHQTAAESVKLAQQKICDVTAAILSEKIMVKQQKAVGKSYFASDFRPEHLIPIYEHRSNKTIKFLKTYYKTFPSPKLHEGI